MQLKRSAGPFAPRETHPEDTALAQFAADTHGAADGLGQMLDDREPQSCAAQFTRSGAVDAIEAFDDSALIGLGAANAIVCDSQQHRVVVVPPRDLNHAPGRRVLDGVVD